MAEKLPEIVTKTLKHILLPEARLIRCSKKGCGYYGGNILDLGLSNLKIPSVLFIEFQTKSTTSQDQSMYPLTLSEEISFQENGQNKVSNYCLQNPNTTSTQLNRSWV